MRILLADDHSLILNGIKNLLENTHEIVGFSENGRVLVDSAIKLKPDLIILDVSMPILNGIDAGREIKKLLPSTRLIFLSMHSNPIYLRKAFDAGASAFVLKSGAAEELLTAIEEARKGRVYVSPALGRNVLHNVQVPTRVAVHLTGRQRQILQLVAEGRQNKEIAEIVNISVKTVEFHRSRLMSKVGAHSIAELTKFAIEEGIINVRHNGLT